MGAFSAPLKAVILLAISGMTFGLPQVSPDGDEPSSSVASPSPSLDSPWSQWMSLKAPPMAVPGGKSKKKKLLPGPAPPEGTPEAPWVSWTRMKVSTALSPPSMMGGGAGSGASSSGSNDSSPESAVYIQWAQMKLPLASPVVAPPGGPETPWDAWTQLKTGPILSGNAGGPPPEALSKRMAPDRYNIASTAAPRLAGYAPPQILIGQQSGSPGTFRLPQTSSSSTPLQTPFLPSQNYLSLFGLTTPSANPAVSAPAGATVGGNSRPSGSNPIPPSSILATILKPIPHQIVSQLLAKGTPQEITQVVEALSSIDDEAPGNEDIQVGHILPPSFFPKIPDELTPLLSTPLVMPSPPPSQLSLIQDESLRQAILKEASPSEEAAVLGTLSQIESLPPAQQPPIAQLQVKTIFPPSLLSKLQSLSPSPVALLEKTLAPPILQKSLPPPVLSSILATSTPLEVATLIQTLSQIEKLLKDYPTPMIGSILPPSLNAKLPPHLASLLAKPVLASAIPAITKLPDPLPSSSAVLSSALPPSVYTEITAKASPAELEDIAETVALLEAAAPAIASPPIISLLPPTLLPKLSPEIKPLLTQPLTLPPTSPLSILPGPVLKSILKVATPEEIPEIVENIVAALEKAKEGSPVVQPIEDLLPPSVVAKLPPQILQSLESPISIPPPPPSTPEATSIIPPAIPSPLATVLSGLFPTPKPVVNAITAAATPQELTELAEILDKLEAVSPESKPLVEKLELGTILPASLLPRLPPSVLPFMSTPIELPPSENKPFPVSPVVSGPSPPPPEINIPVVLSTVISGLSAAPKPVLASILGTATPLELKELADTLTKLLEEATSIPPLPIISFLPPSLLPKLPSHVAPLLSTPVLIPPPNPSLVPILSTVIPVISTAPEPIPTLILSMATPLELSELAEVITKLGAVPPEQKAEVAKLELGTILPPSLISKLPRPVIPMLSTHLVLPSEALVEPSPVSVGSLPPVLQVIPEPVLTSILSLASLTELTELTETLLKLEAIPPEEKTLLPKVPLVTVLPTTLASKLPPTLGPLLLKDLEFPPVPPPATEVPPPPSLLPPPPPEAVDVDDTLPLTPPEKKLLTKWAKIILEKTGNPSPVPPTPGEIPPLQAAWMEWVQLKVNKTAPKVPSPTPGIPATTEYPWTKWLKLKENVTAGSPPLDVTTASPEKAVLDWLESLEKTPATGGVIPPPPTTPLVGVSPETEQKAAEILKELGIDIVDLPPEQIASLLEELEKTAPPSPAVPISSIEVESVPAIPPTYGVPPYAMYPPVPYFSTYIPTKPFIPYWGPPPPSPFIRPPAAPPTSPPISELPSVPTPSPTPTINLTEYLIQNNMIPAETAPSASIPIPILARLLEEQAISSSPPSSPANLSAPDSEPHTVITAGELASLTPTKFAALLKQILKDCNRTNSLVPRSMIGGGPPIFNKGAYYKQKYAGWKKPQARALYPIPSTAFTPQPSTSPSPIQNLLPWPKMEVSTNGTLLDPAYWAAQKSLFLSKLFSTLAKVATADSTTPSPKQQLAKQVNSVLMSDMTRSIKSSTKHHYHHAPQPEADDEEEESSEYENEQSSEVGDDSEDSQSEPSLDGVNEKDLVNKDDSQPRLPKEPDNPLHKLFKFGVQKTVLSDLSTPPPAPQPYYIYVTPPPPPSPATAPAPDKLKETIAKLKSNSAHDKHKKKHKKAHRPSSPSQHHPHAKKKQPRFRGPTTTTDSPVDFELLAKALLMDKTGAKRSPPSSRK